jgi:hypothetical protein
MLRRGAIVVAALAVLAVGVEQLPAAPVPTHLMPKDKPFSFPGVGATWVYTSGNGREETITISSVEDKDGAKLITTEYVRPGGNCHYMTWSVRASGVFLVAEDGRTYPTPWCVFKLPHKEGDTWKTEGHGGDRKAGPMEKVKVAAGEILAARVEWDLGGGRIASYWYADGIGLVKMDSVGGPGKELKSFTRGQE